ncbi:unnamed protein product, partial [Durusdinium trenchii]
MSSLLWSVITVKQTFKVTVQLWLFGSLTVKPLCLRGQWRIYEVAAELVPVRKLLLEKLTTKGDQQALNGIPPQGEDPGNDDLVGMVLDSSMVQRKEILARHRALKQNAAQPPAQPQPQDYQVQCKKEDFLCR